MDDILQRILATKRDEVKAARAGMPPAQLHSAAQRAPASRDFTGAMRASLEAGRSAVIAEIKKASPSKGVLRADFNPAAIGMSYARHGASCLSVLTDMQYFQGAADDLRQARSASGLPVLRKDFIIDEYQIVEARALGCRRDSADCRCTRCGASVRLRRPQHAISAWPCSSRCTMRPNWNCALQLATPLIGINNRNLRTFETRLETTLDLLPRIGPERIVVTESGILAPADVERMRLAGVHAFLVGEAFMRAADPGAELARLFR